jgi:hypothetical protein
VSIGGVGGVGKSRHVFDHVILSGAKDLKMPGCR